MSLPRLTTARLCIRACSRDDLDDILEMDIDPEVYQFSEMRRGRPAPERSLLRKAIRRELLSGSYQNLWAIEWRHQRGFLGVVGFSPGRIFTNVLAFRLGKSAWDQGIATEAASAALNYGFKVLRLPLIEAFAHHQNWRSHRVLVRIGMKQDGIAVLPRSPNSLVALRSITSPADPSAGETYLTYSIDRESYLQAPRASNENPS